MKKLATLLVFICTVVGLNAPAISAPITLNFVSTGNQLVTGTMTLPDDSLLTTGSYNFFFNSSSSTELPPAGLSGRGSFAFPFPGPSGNSDDFTGLIGIRSDILRGRYQWVELKITNGVILGGFDTGLVDGGDSAFGFGRRGLFYYSDSGRGWSSSDPRSGVTLSGYWVVADTPVPVAPTHLLVALGLALSLTFAQKFRNRRSL
jgi:hypothetical protein